MAIDYDQLFTTLQQGLVNNVVDSTGQPLLSSSRVILPSTFEEPDHPFVVLYVPVSVSEDDVGMNPPLRRALDPIVQAEIIAGGTVSEVMGAGELAGRLLFDNSTDFTSLNLTTDPKELRPGNHVVNTTSGETSVVEGVIEPHIARVKDPIFLKAGESYEVHRINANLIRYSGRVVTVQASVEDTHGVAGHDPLLAVNQIVEGIHNYFALKAPYDLSFIDFMIDHGGLGEVVVNDYTQESGRGPAQRVYRRDYRVRLRTTDVLEWERSDLVTRVQTGLKDVDSGGTWTSDTQEYDGVPSP